MDKMSYFNYSIIDEAYSRINSKIIKTPLVTSEFINEITRTT